MIEKMPATYGEEYGQITPRTDVIEYWNNIVELYGTEALENTPMLLNISAPSAGGGKRTVAKTLTEELEQRGVPVRFPKSATTRPMRNEDDFDQYHLLRVEDGKDIGEVAAHAKFWKLVNSGDIVECASVESSSGTNWYGKLLEPQNLAHPGVTIIETEIVGVKSLKLGATIELPSGVTMRVNPLRGLVSVHLLPTGQTINDMLSSLDERMRGRPGETSETVNGRIWAPNAPAPREIHAVLSGQIPIDHLVVNQDWVLDPEHAAPAAVTRIVDAYLNAKKEIIDKSRN